MLSHATLGYSAAVESESARGSGEATQHTSIVFMSDASAEAGRLTLSLGDLGYTVADVPLALLAGRVTVQRPSLVLCDAGSEGVIEVLNRIRELTRDARLPIILLGERDGTIAHLSGGLVEAAFARPVNVQELLGTIERLIGRPPIVRPASLPPPGRGATAMSSRPPARPSAAPTSRAGGERSVRLDGAGVVSAAIPLPPDLTDDAGPPKDTADPPPGELGPDLHPLLPDPG